MSLKRKAQSLYQTLFSEVSADSYDAERSGSRRDPDPDPKDKDLYRRYQNIGDRNLEIGVRGTFRSNAENGPRGQYRRNVGIEEYGRFRIQDVQSDFRRGGNEDSNKLHDIEPTSRSGHRGGDEDRNKHNNIEPTSRFGHRDDVGISRFGPDSNEFYRPDQSEKQTRGIPGRSREDDRMSSNEFYHRRQDNERSTFKLQYIYSHEEEEEDRGTSYTPQLMKSRRSVDEEEKYRRRRDEEKEGSGFNARLMESRRNVDEEEKKRRGRDEEEEEERSSFSAQLMESRRSVDEEEIVSSHSQPSQSFDYRKRNERVSFRLKPARSSPKPRLIEFHEKRREAEEAEFGSNESSRDREGNSMSSSDLRPSEEENRGTPTTDLDEEERGRKTATFDEDVERVQDYSGEGGGGGGFVPERSCQRVIPERKKPIIE